LALLDEDRPVSQLAVELRVRLGWTRSGVEGSKELFHEALRLREVDGG
jgi:hypothetical protein